MSTEDAKDVVTGTLPGCNHIEIQKAWQTLVNTGEVWRMPVKYGKTASYMLAAGVLERNAA